MKSQREVAEAFDVSHQTIRGSWRSAGMPGKPGSYDLLAIAMWRLEYERELRDKPGRSVGNSRIGELDEQLKLVELERRQLELERAKGDVISRQSALHTVSTLSSALSEQIMAAADEIETLLPADVAPVACAEIRRYLQQRLTAFSESGSRAITDQARLGDERQAR